MVSVLFSNSDIVVVDKPSGWVVHRTPGAEQFPVLLQTLRDQLDTRIYPVHRLDRGTSGCLAFGLQSEAAQKLQSALQQENTQKTYLALCMGDVSDNGIWDRPLKSSKGVPQDAKTEYRKLEKIGLYSLVEVRLWTGRTHQIRRHFSHERHHLIGDVEHGKGWLNRKFRSEYDFHRLFLHCSRLKWTWEDKEIDVQCPLPAPMGELLQKLRTHR